MTRVNLLPWHPPRSRLHADDDEEFVDVKIFKLLRLVNGLSFTSARVRHTDAVILLRRHTHVNPITFRHASHDGTDRSEIRNAIGPRSRFNNVYQRGARRSCLLVSEFGLVARHVYASTECPIRERIEWPRRVNASSRYLD